MHNYYVLDLLRNKKINCTDIYWGRRRQERMYSPYLFSFWHKIPTVKKTVLGRDNYRVALILVLK